MKKITLTLVCIFSTSMLFSTNIFFSEWAEGSSYNKYIEIYNGTGAEIDLSNYKISSCANGCNTSGEWDYPDQVIFDTGTMVAAGDVFVLAHPSADESITDVAGDLSFTYMSNGNDAFGLVEVSTGSILDIVGDMRLNFDPDDFPAWSVAGVENGTKEHTIVRKPSVLTGNTDWAASAGTDASNSEWTVFDQNIWDDLGLHSQAVDAPEATISTVSPTWITASNEITVTVSVTTPVGTIDSVKIKFGTNNQLVNVIDLYEDEDGGNIWAGEIPAQQGNTLLQMRVHAFNSEGTEGQSVIVDRMIASSTHNSIESLYSSQSINEIVTIKGIVTIGYGLLHPTSTKVYVQDVSGRGMCLYSSESFADIERGDELEIVGYTHYEENTFELIDFEYREISNENSIPDPIIVSSSDANSSQYEGTLISITGTITGLPSISNMTNIEIDGVTDVVIWNSTGIDVSNFIVGYRGQFIGVGSQYNDQYQLLVGYQSDISTALGIEKDNITPDRFALMPAYPNPFNPVSNISFSIDMPSNIQLEIFDTKGRLVDVIAKGFFQSGPHSVDWNASSHASGIYFVQLVKGNKRLTQKVMFVK